MRVFATVLFVFFFVASRGQSQNSTTRPLITRQVDSSRMVTLPGSLHRLARAEFDKGAAPEDLPVEHVMLVLKRSPEQEAALQSLLQNQQDKSSPEYRHWLTPQQFGQRFGPSDEDIQSISTWLESKGFQIGHVSPGRTAIEFSGTAGAIQSAFHTQIHRYFVDGQEHWANATNPEIPAALEPAVAGVVSLHNFFSQPQIKTTGHRIAATKSLHGTPQITFSGGAHALSPADYAVIYNISPLYQGGINGSGKSIAVLGRSNFNVQDVSDFRRVFGLPSAAPQIILNGNDPGNLGGAEEAEAVLDVSWAGAVAPYATVKFILSASTNTTDGVDLSEEYAINNNVADVITESFGDCEANHTQADAVERASLAEQAAAQGITFLVAAGDSGAAGCDSPMSYAATRAASVNILASNPYTVAVGGTAFNENGSSIYWGAQNGSGFESAHSYIPENVWNASCSQSTCGVSANLYAGGGGRSIFYSKPPWQEGVAGIPSDGARDLPDVSLTAAANNDPYVLCLGGSCAANSSGTISFVAVGGTSASAPAFAGIMALVDQKTNARQGQANYILYQLASGENLSQCNGSNTSGLPANTCIFNDVTVGSNTVPAGPGYQASTGYDLASGLGSVNVTNLVAQWGNSAGFTGTYYEIVNRGSGKALDVRGESTADGAGIEQWDFWNGPNQQWQLVPVDSVYYRIVSRGSAKALDVTGMSIANGAGIEQWDYWGGDNQQWQLVPTDSGYYRIVSKNSGKVLDVGGQSTSNGAAIQQWDFWGGFNQQWKLIPAQ